MILNLLKTVNRYSLLKYAGIAALLCTLVFAFNVHANETIENKLKTAYIINIATFTKWKKVNQTIVLCISDRSAIFDHVIMLNEHVLDDGRKIEVVVNPEEFTRCQILYWDKDSHSLPASTLFSSQYPGLLMISDSKGALQEGFTIQFFLRNLKLRFSVNREVLKNVDYTISSKLLRLSRQVD